MTDPTQQLPRDEPAGTPWTRVARIIEWFALACLLALLVMRLTQPGMPPTEIETSAIGVMTALALALALLLRWFVPAEGRLASGNERRALQALLLYGGALILAMLIPFGQGNVQEGLDTGRAWLCALLMAVVVGVLGRDAERRRFLVASLVAGLAMIAVYSLYHAVYALPYLRDVLAENRDALRTLGVSSGVSGQLFQDRLESNRAFGSFAYANTLAGVMLLAAPLVVGVMLQSRAGNMLALFRRERVLRGAFFVVLCAFALTGSRGGFMAIKVVEVLALLLLLPQGVSWRDAWQSVLTAVLVWSLGGVVLYAAGDYGVAYMGLTGGLGEIIPRLLWLGWSVFAWLVLSDQVTRGVFSGQLVRWLGWGMISMMLVLGAGLVMGHGRAPEAPAPLRTAQEAVDIRMGYWQGAVNMAAQAPVRGVGLGNFGERYGEFKPASAWEAQHPHNHYLLLWSEGGLPLLLFFVATVGFTLLTRSEPEAAALTSSPPGQTPKRIWLGRLGMFGGPLALYALYALRDMTGVFGGLSIEFFLLEQYGEAWQGSQRALHGTRVPLWVHGVTHFAVLPLVWWAVFRAVWRVDLNWAALRPWLKIALVGVLLHALVDQHMTFMSMQMLFWMVLGLILATSAPAPDTAPRPMWKMGFLGVTLGLVIVMTGVLQLNLITLIDLHQLDEMGVAARNLSGRRDPARQKVIEAQYEQRWQNLVKARPYDAALWWTRLEDARTALIQQAQRAGINPYLPRPGIEQASSPALRKIYTPERVRELRVLHEKIVSLRPHSAFMHHMAGMFQWQMASLMSEGSGDTPPPQAAALLARAVDLYPSSLSLRMNVFAWYTQTQAYEELYRQAREITRLHARVTDERVTLYRREVAFFNAALNDLAKRDPTRDWQAFALPTVNAKRLDAYAP